MQMYELVDRIERQLVGIASQGEIANACYQIWQAYQRKERLRLRQAFDDGLEGRPPSSPTDEAYMSEYRSGLNYSGHKICDLRGN